jgi:hypothetical protein
MFYEFHLFASIVAADLRTCCYCTSQLTINCKISGRNEYEKETQPPWTFQLCLSVASRHYIESCTAELKTFRFLCHLTVEFNRELPCSVIKKLQVRISDG